MKLEPVYLLPPDPDRQVHMSRRAFLGAAVAVFGAGAAVGAVANGALFSRRSTDSPQADPKSDPAAADSDSDLAWARRLATGPIDELARQASPFVAICATRAEDEVLQDGLRRLVIFVADDAEAPNRRVAAIVIHRHFQRFPPTDSAISERLPKLRRLHAR